MGDTLYALSQGAYSDYHVLALFTSKKLAEQALEAHKADEEWSRDARIEEFDLFDELPEPVTEHYYQVEIWDDGRVTNENIRQATHLPWNHLDGTPKPRPHVRWVRAPMYRDQGGRLEVRGSDEQAVKQAFSDNKARILAEIEGIS